MQRPLRIKVDVDGVLRDTFGAMCRLYNKEFGTQLGISDIKDYSVDVSFPEIRKKYRISAVEWFFTSHPRECFGAKPIPGSPEAVKKLREAGHKVLICSHQPTRPGREYTLEFLKAYDIHYDELHFTHEKHFVISDVLIDDSPEFLSLGDDLKIKIDYPFNTSCKTPWNAKNLWEASEIILKDPLKFLSMKL